MTGTELRSIRDGMQRRSSRKLAKRLGIHRSTVDRNLRRDTVTGYVRGAVARDRLAMAFLRGVRQGRSE